MNLFHIERNRQCVLIDLAEYFNFKVMLWKVLEYSAGIARRLCLGLKLLICMMYCTNVLKHSTLIVLNTEALRSSNKLET